MKELGGIIPILATPFSEQGEVDGESFRRLVEASVQDGVHGLAMFGLASEYYKLSDSERVYLTELLIRQANGRVPVVISITHQARDVAVRQACEAAAMGADALMIMPPFFLGPTVESIVRHIEGVARAVTLPIIVQYAPLQTGRVLSPETFAELHRKHPNITHVKVDTVPSGTTITALQQAAGVSLKSIVGYMGLHLPEDVVRGVAGCAPSASLGRAFVRLWSLLCQGGDEGRILHQRFLPILNFMMQSVEMLISCEKLLLARRGIISSACSREPAFHLDSFQLAELERHATVINEWLPNIRRI